MELSRSCSLFRSHNSRETDIVAKFLLSLFGSLAYGQSFPARCSLPHHARVIQVRKLTLALVWPCANAPIRSQPPTLLKYYALTRIFYFIHNLCTILFSFVAGSFRTNARKPYPPLRKQFNNQFKGKNGKNKFCRIEPARGRGKPLLVKANYVKALTRIVSAFSPARRLPAFGSHLRREVCRKCRIYSF